MSRPAPLAGLRVLETATGIAGPYAGRLLAMFGATVAKLEPEGGDPTRTQPIDDEPLAPGRTSPLFSHLNAGKHSVSGEIDAAWADVVIASDTLSTLAGGPFDPDALSAHDTKLVTATAWGADADEAGEIADELIVQAATGFLGFNRDPDDGPLRLPGWQSQYAAGGLAASAAMIVQRLAATHIDVSWFGALLTCTELCWGDALHCQRRRDPVGAHPPTAFPSGALPCKDGFVTPGSLRPVDWEMQCLMYGTPEWIDDPDYAHRHRRPSKIPEIWERVAPWYAERTKREIFQHALDTPWAIGMIMTPTDALADEHLAARGLMGAVTHADGTSIRVPARPVKMQGLPVPDQRIPAQASTPFGALDDGSRRDRPLRRFRDLRIIEMTIAWAGPYVGNVLAPLGVDIIKIEAQNPFDGFRTQRPYDHGMAPGLEHLVHDNRFYEAGGLFNAVNKGKRDCVMSLRTPDGRAAFLELVANCDGLIANFSAHVLPDLGLDWATLQAANPALVVVRAPAFGTDGPYADATGYGSIVEAMSGLGQRQGYEREGARISNIYFPDPIAGIHIAAALMAGLDHADRTGEGVEIDLSHQEVTWLHSGEALVLAAESGRDIARMGNREPGVDLADFWECADGWICVVAHGAAASAARAEVDAVAELSMAAATELLRGLGARAEATLDPWTAPDQPRLAERLTLVDHPVTGPMRQIVSPFLVDGERPEFTGPAPLFDQHTDEVLSQVAGIDDGRLATLRESGAIGGELPPPATLGFRYD